jgi:hypothetical protein
MLVLITEGAQKHAWLVHLHSSLNLNGEGMYAPHEISNSCTYVA